MPMHPYYDENFIVCEPKFEEFDPNLDDPRNPRASVRMLQSVGCLTLVTALLVASAIGGCYQVVQRHQKVKEEKPTTEQRLPKKVASRMQSWDTTWSQALQERGSR